ncbi:MAG: hypothetical protein ACTSRS_13080 [Candidatus Helarchaeota archaeon]
MIEKDHGNIPNVSCMLDPEATTIPLEKYLTKAIYEPLHYILKEEKGVKIFQIIYPLLKEGATHSLSTLYQTLQKKFDNQASPSLQQELKKYLQEFIKYKILIKVKRTNTSTEEVYSLNPTLVYMGTKSFKSEVEFYYAPIYAIACSIVRVLRMLYPREKAEGIYTLTRRLLEIQIVLVLEDLRTRRIATKPCAECFFPIGNVSSYLSPATSNPPPNSNVRSLQAQTSSNTPLPDVTSNTITPPIPKSGELSTQIKEYIRTHGGSEQGEGTLETAIYRKFADIPKEQIWDCLNQLVAEGILYKPTPQSFKLL